MRHLLLFSIIATAVKSRPQSKFSSTSVAFSLPSKSIKPWLQSADVSIVIQASPPKGSGVFAAQTIPKDTFISRYHGSILTLEQHEQLYPNSFPDYCLQIGNLTYIDGQNSQHFSRFINHNEFGNLKVHTNAQQRVAYFTALKDIAKGEELSFDYGVGFFIVRGIVPAKDTESRSLEPPERVGWDNVRANPPPVIPRSDVDVENVLNGNQNEEEKKLSLLRALDFYGIDRDGHDGDDLLRLPVGFKENEDGGEMELVYREFLFLELTSVQLAGFVTTLWRQLQA